MSMKMENFDDGGAYWEAGEPICVSPDVIQIFVRECSFAGNPPIDIENQHLRNEVEESRIGILVTLH